MEKCYEYFACSKTECIMFNDKSETHCWDCENTLCNHDLVDKERFQKLGISICKACMYYREFQNRN